MAPLRTRVVRSPVVAAARSALGIAGAPVISRRIDTADHTRRLQQVRWLLPGSLGQVHSEITGFGALAAARAPERICEIGTLHGGTSLFLCGLAPSVRTFVGVDIEIRNSRLIRALAPPPVRVRHIEGSSREERVHAAVAADQPLDILFVDGDHSYAGVKADLLEYRELVKPGGLIAFHDIVAHRPGADADPGEVPRFWKEIHDRFQSWEFVESWDQGGFGIGVIENDPAVSLT